MALYEPISTEEDENLFPAEKGVAFCNRLFFKERLYKELSPEERKAKRLEEETQSGMNSGPGLTRWIHPEEANWRKRLSMP